MISRQTASETEGKQDGKRPFAATDNELLKPGATTQEEFLLISQKRS
jgi:hypothetical protein